MSLNNEKPKRPIEEYTKGIFYKELSDAQKTFIATNFSIRPHDFYEWCMTHQDKMVRGWLNISIINGEKGQYGVVDTFKPESTPEQKAQAQEYRDNKYQTDPKAQQNQKEASQIFQGGLSDEELKSLDEIPF